MTVTLVPRTACPGQRTDKIQLQLDEDSSPSQQPRKRRRAGEVPPKLAAILENERSPPPEVRACSFQALPSYVFRYSQYAVQLMCYNTLGVVADGGR